MNTKLTLMVAALAATTWLFPTADAFGATTETKTMYLIFPGNSPSSPAGSFNLANTAFERDGWEQLNSSNVANLTINGLPFTATTEYYKTPSNYFGAVDISSSYGLTIGKKYSTSYPDLELTSFKLSTEAFKGKKIIQVGGRIEKTNNIPYNVILTVGSNNRPLDFTYQGDLNGMSGDKNFKNLNWTGDNFCFEVKYNASYSSGSYPCPITIVDLYVTYEETVEEEDKKVTLELPDLSNLVWNSNQAFSTNIAIPEGLTNDDLTVSMVRKFDLLIAPDDSESANKWEEWGKMDAYNSYGDHEFKPEVSLAADGTLKVEKVPCSGLYELTLSTKDGLAGYVPASVTAEVNIHPTLEGELTINGRTVDESNHIDLECESGGCSIGASIITHSTIAADLYYLVSTEQTESQRPRRVEGETEEDSLSGYTKLEEGTGIDLTNGNTLSLKLQKNGSVSAERRITYTLPSGSVGVAGIEAEQGNVEFFTPAGIRVNSENLTPGLYIKRNANRSEKIIIR